MNLLWVALKYLKRLLKSPDDFTQCVATLSDVLGLTKGIQNGLVLVDLLVKLCLQLILGHANQEETNQLRNNLTNRANRDLEHSIDTGANLLNEDVFAAHHGLLLLLHLLLLLWNRLTVLVILLRHLVFGGHDGGAVLLVVGIVDEHVVLLRVNDGLHEFSRVVTLTLQDLADNVHDLGA